MVLCRTAVLFSAFVSVFVLGIPVCRHMCSELPLEGLSEPDGDNGIMTYVTDESFNMS